MDEPRPFDCLDFKLMLTALVDGTAPEAARHGAERHALACPSCLRLLEEAENTDFMLKLAARAESQELPAGFAEAVLARGTGAESAERAVIGSIAGAPQRRGGGWRETSAWLVAAAAVALAAGLWWRPAGERASSGSMATLASEREITAPVWSGVREWDESDASALAERPLGLDDVSIETLRDAAGALDRIGEVNPDDEQAVLQLRDALRREDALILLAAARERVPHERRADVVAAESSLHAFIAGCVDPAQLRALQTTLRRLGLADRLRDVAATSPRDLAAAW